MSTPSFRLEQVLRERHRRDRDCAHRSATSRSAIEGADRCDEARIASSVDVAFDSGERLAKALAHHPKERARPPTDGAPTNLSNAQ